MTSELVLATHEHWVDHGGAWWPIFPIFWILFFVCIFLLARRPCGGRHRSAGESVLGERYARGEINEQEYRERLSVLKQDNSR